MTKPSEAAMREATRIWADYLNNVILSENMIPEIARALDRQRERCAQWHEIQRDYHDSKAAKAEARGADHSASWHERKAHFHKESAAAIRESSHG